MNKRHLISVLVALVLSLTVSAGEPDNAYFADAEKQIAGVAAQLSASRYNDAAQDSLASKTLSLLGAALKHDDSFSYPFDSLRNDISIVVSPDGRVRIFTWFSVGDAGNYRYFGYLQYNDKQAQKVRLFELNDCSSTIENYDNMTLTPQNWRGMLYYSIVEKKMHGDVYYTLIGWDGCGLYTTKKIIEPLTFTEKGQPRFGKSMIKVGQKKYKRLVFEYNKRATMMIQYDEALDLIVLDHLAVMGTQDTDNPMFYGPDMSCDALKFEDGLWFYQTNIKYQRPAKGKRR
ncbi:MAG: hypothetical protein IKW77_03130 [Salinivirgaceae bacterium]|nr:hypothetical protein [Salinivirgaceae bacterium]